MSYLPQALRDRLLEIDNRHCAYCHTTEANSGQPMTIDHILPQAQGGETNLENLCFACRRCNEFKGSAIIAVDPLTGETESLFHPRRQNWADHFRWDESGTIVVGLTATGRATIIALNMNNSVIVDVRRRWVSVGWHPPGIQRLHRQFAIRPAPYAVIVPFGAGCASIADYPYHDLRSERPRAVLSMFDVPARLCVPPGVLTFTIPQPKFGRMVDNLGESFLITVSWDKVRGRIKRWISDESG